MNNDSPSSFSGKNTVSDETNPFLAREFSLFRLEGAEQVITYGEISEEFVSN